MDPFVHVWPIQWEGDANEESRQWLDWLSVAEKNQVERFVHPFDRQRYILAHGYCRLILSRYVNQKPNEIQFGEERNHKPIVLNAPAVHFNLSHAANVAVIAVSNRPVGIDIEWMDPTLVRKEMVEQFMSEKEQALFFRLPSSKQKQVFYWCWTRKEAYVKALGEGLFYPVKKVTVPLGEEPCQTWSDECQPDEPTRWNMEHMEPIAEYVGAVVHQGRCVVYHSLKRI